MARKTPVKRKIKLNFVHDDDVEDDIKVIESAVKRSRTLETIQEDGDDEAADYLSMYGKYRTSSLVERGAGDHVRGAAVFGFRTPKKRDQMALKAVELQQQMSPRTPSSAAKRGRPRKSAPSTPVSSSKVTPSKRSLPATPHSKKKLKLSDSPVKSPRTPKRGATPLKTPPATPYSFRKRVRNTLEKIVEETQPEDDLESTSEEDESDASVDESDDEGMATAGSQSPAKTPSTPVRRRLTKQETPSTPITPRRRGRSAPKAVKVIHDNADDFFEASAANVMTSDETLSRLKTPRLDQEAMQTLLSEYKPPYEEEVKDLLEDYRACFSKWELLLKEDFNLVLYGLGSKKSILQDFQTERLSEEHCVVVNGFFPSVTIKQILNSITVDILDHDGTFSTVPEQLDFIASEFQEGDPLFLIVNNIDGQMLRNEKSQGILASLASHPNIHLICSIDHINAPLIWDQYKMSKFNFVWFDATTFLPYTEETLNENSLMVKNSGELALNSLTHVFASLTPNAKGIFVLLTKHQIEESEDDPLSYRGMSFTDLYKKCREAFLVNSDLTLRAQLTEFKDHKLVRIKKGIDGSDSLVIPLENATLKEFLEANDEKS